MNRLATPIYDEGFAEERPCRIHKGGPNHVHIAVCSVCMMPLTAELHPAFCDHRVIEVRWKCMYDPDAERAVLSTSEILEREPWRGELHHRDKCCTCQSRTAGGGTVVHRILWVDDMPTQACLPSILNDPTRLSGCYCDLQTREALSGILT